MCGWVSEGASEGVSESVPLSVYLCLSLSLSLSVCLCLQPPTPTCLCMCTCRAIDRVDAELEELAGTKAALDQQLTRRKRQFALLLHAARDLKAVLEEPVDSDNSSPTTTRGSSSSSSSSSSANQDGGMDTSVDGETQ